MLGAALLRHRVLERIEVRAEGQALRLQDVQHALPLVLGYARAGEGNGRVLRGGVGTARGRRARRHGAKEEQPGSEKRTVRTPEVKVIRNQEKWKSIGEVE